jgi:hydrogenase maturation protease
MNDTARARCAVVGVGHPDRGDDAVGLLVAERVADVGLVGVDVVPARTPVDLLDVCADYASVVVVDAVRSQGIPPGTVTIRNYCADEPPPLGDATGTHGFGLGSAIRLAWLVGNAPERVTVVGVVVEQTDLGRGLSAAVAGALPAAATAVIHAAADGGVV